LQSLPNPPRVSRTSYAKINVMKKYIIVSIGIIIFFVVYRFTNSWKLSLIILGALTFYIFWIIGIESGGFRNSRKESIEKRFDSIKEEHIKKTENNPTIR
jgi:hypothetical protein